MSIKIIKYGSCSLFNRKYNFSAAPGWGICPLFYALPWGFWMNRPAPPWGICSFSKRKNNKIIIIIITNARGKGGMGTLGIAWTIIDQTKGQDDWILAEFPFPFLLTEKRPRYSHLDRTSSAWSIKDYYMGKKTTFSWGPTGKFPSPLS